MKIRKKILSVLMLAIIITSYSIPIVEATDVEQAEDVEETVKSDVVEEDTKKDETEVQDVEEDTNVYTTLDEYVESVDKDENSFDYHIVTNEVIEQLQKSPGDTYNVVPIGAWTNLSSFGVVAWGKMTIYTVNDDIVFCLQYGTDVTSIATQTDSENSYYNSLTDEQKDLIEYVGNYATTLYKKNNNMDYLFAGQILIWDILDPSGWNITNSGTDIQSEVDELYDVYVDHSSIPSFTAYSSANAHTHVLEKNDNTGLFEVILEDKNNVFEDKLDSLVGTYGDYTITKESTNSLKVTTNNASAKSQVIEGEFIPFGSGVNKYYDAGQNLISPSPSPLSMYLKLEVEPTYGSVIVNKVGESLDETNDNLINLGGVDFALVNASDGQTFAVGTTDENGILEFTNVPIGDYQLVETDTVEGYYVLADFENITVTYDQVTNIEIVNEHVEGGFEINKSGESLDETDNSLVNLENVEFELYQDTDLDGTYEQYVDTIITDENGYATMSNLDYGKYKLVESVTNDGYIADFEEEFEIVSEDTFITYDVENSHIEGSMKLTKIGQEYDDSLEPLENVEFELYQDVDFDDSYETYVGTYYTDAKGELLIENLDYGNYNITETDAPDNYYADFTQDFEIRNDDEVITVSNSDDYVLNNKTNTEIVITKEGETLDNNSDDYVLLEGTEFTLYTDSNSNGELDLTEQMFGKVETSTTNDEGKAYFSDVDLSSDYIIVETASSDGYILNEDVILIVNADTPYTVVDDLRTYTFEMSNEAIRGQMDLNKVAYSDERDLEEPLANAVFAIYQDSNYNGEIDEDESEPIEYIKTNEDGYGISTDLKFGNYLIKEISAPSSVVVDDSTIYSASITKDGEVVGLNNSEEIMNKYVENEIKIKKTDAATKEEVEGAELVIYDSDGEVYEKWTSTGEEHTFTAVYGEYEICETIPPEGYQLLEECIPFSVTEDGVEQHFELENVMNPTSTDAKIIDTGLDSRFYIISAILILISSLFVIRKKIQ